MSMSSRRLGASSLLATTSVAALLLGALAAPARAQTTPVVVTDPTPVDGTVTIGPDATALVIDLPSFTGNVVNPNFLPLNQNAQLSSTNTGLAIRSTSFTGSVTNAGQINVNVRPNFALPTPAEAARQNVIGIAIGPAGGSGGTFTGSIINSGEISAFGAQVRDINGAGNAIPGTQVPANFALASAIKVQETVTGSIVNTGTGGFGNSLFVSQFTLLPFTINAFPPQSIPGALDVTAPVLGGIRNAGFISATSAVGIRSTAAIPGGIINTGYIGGALFGPGSSGGTAAAIVASGPLQGAITNSGTIAGSGSPSPALGPEIGTGIAIDVSQVTTPTTITQMAGQILGSIALSGNADRVVITGGGVGGSITAPAGSAAGVTLAGGVLAFGPNLGFGDAVPFVAGQGTVGTNPDSASNLAFITQTGGTLVLQVNNTAAPGTFPTVSAGNITLTSVAAAGQQGAFAAGTSLIFPKIITATGTLTDNAPSNLQVFDFFSNAVTAKLVPDGTNSLDLVLTNTGATAVTPGVANATAFTGNFLNPAGGLLLQISVTNGSNITGTIRSDGVVETGITFTGSTLSGSIVNTGIVQGGIGVSGLVTGNGTAAGGVVNSGIVTPAHSFSPVAILQPGVPIFAASTFASPNAFSTNIRVVAAPSFTGNITNSGFLVDGNGIFADGGPIAGSITNSGQIFNTSGSLAFGSLDNFIAGTPISGTSPAIESVGIRVGSGPLAGGITNSGDIHIGSGSGSGSGNVFNILTGTTVGNFADLGVNGAVGIGVIGSIGTNLGLNLGDLTGVNTPARQIITGDIVNSGTIEVTALHQPVALGIDVAATGLFAGNVRNSGSITATGLGFTGVPGTQAVTQAQLNQAIADNGGVVDPVIANLLAFGGGRAVGIQIGSTGLNEGQAGAFRGTVVNSGVITAIGAGTIEGGIPVSGIGIATNVPILGGITNTGTITGSTASIDLTQEVGGSTVINQAGGALFGDVKLSANADVLDFSGGLIVNAVTVPSGNHDLVLITGQGATFAPTASTSGVSAFTVSPNARLTLQVTPTQAPMIAANAITLNGTLTVAPQGNPFAFAAAHSAFRDVFVSGTPIQGAFATVNSTISLFGVTLTPDATTANALDINFALSAAGLAASAQDLTQGVALGLDAPRVLSGAVEDRLIANGGVLGEGPGSAGAGQKGLAGFSFGNANVWARGADQFGSATAPASGAGVGYDINRAAPFIAGIDWRLDNDIVAGVAATYVSTFAKFKDGSSTAVNSYQGAAYAGWADGPWYALGSAVVSFNDFSSSRLLTPFGIPGDATSSPSGQSYQGHAEAGYHWVLPAAGVTMSVTPYAALDYVNAHISGFSENGGFGALSVNATDANSFQTTLGMRFTSRIALAGYGTLIPEIRLGWNHEFLDASQSLSAALIGVPGSNFSATGIALGRNTALIGAGFSMELSPDAKVFVDYDGKLGSRLQEHSISGGLRLRF
jgi:outer membrane autotransporter protein